MCNMDRLIRKQQMLDSVVAERSILSYTEERDALRSRLALLEEFMWADVAHMLDHKLTSATRAAALIGVSPEWVRRSTMQHRKDTR